MLYRDMGGRIKKKIFNGYSKLLYISYNKHIEKNINKHVLLFKKWYQFVGKLSRRYTVSNIGLKKKIIKISKLSIGYRIYDFSYFYKANVFRAKIERKKAEKAQKKKNKKKTKLLQDADTATVKTPDVSDNEQLSKSSEYKNDRLDNNLINNDEIKQVKKVDPILDFTSKQKFRPELMDLLDSSVSLEYNKNLLIANDSYQAVNKTYTMSDLELTLAEEKAATTGKSKKLKKVADAAEDKEEELNQKNIDRSGVWDLIKSLQAASDEELKKYTNYGILSKKDNFSILNDLNFSKPEIDKILLLTDEIIARRDLLDKKNVSDEDKDQLAKFVNLSEEEEKALEFEESENFKERVLNWDKRGRQWTNKTYNATPHTDVFEFFKKKSLGKSYILLDTVYFDKIMGNTHFYFYTKKKQSSIVKQVKKNI